MRQSVLLTGGLVLTPVLAWLALPGKYEFWPVLAICLVPLLCWLAAAPSFRGAWWRGFGAGVVFYLLQLYWILSVLQTYGGLPWYLAGPALVLLACYMSLYLAVFAGCLHLLLLRGAVWLLLGAPAVWVGLDWVRSWFLGGFPWLDLGYGLAPIPVMLQSADLIGHYGSTFLVVLVNLALFGLLEPRFTPYRRLGGLAAALAMVMAVGAYGGWRWQQVGQRLAAAEHGVVGIAQGNVEQERKWSAAEQARTVADYLRLSSFDSGSARPAVVLWPETALPFFPPGNPLTNPIQRYAARTGTAVLTGAPWYELRDAETRQLDNYNSAVLIGTDGTFGGIYHKSHLVPYGEYVPFERLMPFIKPLVVAAGDFSRGRVETPLEVGNLRLGVLICYESIFEYLGRAWVEAGANLLVNLTNDAWYGKSSAPHQSWAMTIFRAVETRRSLARAANTGISGVIDPLGRVTAKSALFVPWSRTATVPLLDERTGFTRGGWLFAPLCALLGAVVCVMAAARGGPGTPMSASRTPKYQPEVGG